MCTQSPSIGMAAGFATVQQAALLRVLDEHDAGDTGVLDQRLTAEADALLEQLEAAVTRLALAYQPGAFDDETQMMDDDGFAWVHQSIEDVAATLRGLALKRRGK